jgi:4'-phosphopantetheinyl transferase
MPLVHIYYTRFTKQLPNHIQEAYLETIPVSLREKNRRFYRWQDQHSHLFGKLLLSKAFENYFPQLNLSQITFNEYSRPYVEGVKMDFNITHSSEYVLCAIGENVKIGIDVEKIREINLSDFKNVMTDEQWAHIYSSQNAFQSFFRYWTIKESVIKADSRGLTIPLLDLHVKNNTVHYDNQLWHLRELTMDQDYSIYLASNSSDITLNLCEIDFYTTFVGKN